MFAIIAIILIAIAICAAAGIIMGRWINVQQDAEWARAEVEREARFIALPANRLRW